jgi:hypothetical protein
MGPPAGLVLALQRQLRLEDFVETGTYRGDTAAWAAAHFARVITIELSPEYHASAVERFRAQPQIRVLHGNSGAMLGQVLPGLSAPALFWLDAHWSGLDTAGRDSECPLLEELALINAAAPTHLIMVDDARLFCAPPPRPHRAEQWPVLAEVAAHLADRGRRHVVIFDDVFIAVPAACRNTLVTWLQDELAVRRAGGWWSRWGRRLRG